MSCVYPVAGFQAKDQLSCISIKLKEKVCMRTDINSISRRFVRNTFLAIPSLLWGTNMAAVTSCENQ